VIAKQDLLKVKARALRLNVWFKVLSKTERAIMDLTLKCVEQIRSLVLEETITSILDKIMMALERRFLAKADEVGRKIAEKLGEIAKKWGNNDAFSWKLDTGFVRFLGINAVNQ